MVEQSKAAQLKDEGNIFYARQSYLQAYTKYSQAIAEDKSNAVLYTNRAACCLEMKKYQQAMDDSKKAIELHPGYAKAWARLAAAHYAFVESKLSIEAWQKALDLLPKSNLTPGELKQKGQYEAGLKAAQEAPIAMRMSNTEGRGPWDSAIAMKPDLCEHEMNMASSSAWVILNAYEEFIDGVRSMYQLKNMRTPAGWMMLGMLDALTGLTNGVLRDERVFHVDKSDWMTKYHDQVQFEAQKTNAWVDAGPEVVINESQERLCRQGWDVLRPALSVTVRAWIMRGFIEGGLRAAYPVALEFLGYALEVLDWGRHTWKNIPDEVRGAIFKSTFIRGVRSLRIKALMEVYDDNPGLDSKFLLIELLDEADEILRDMQVNPQPPGSEYDHGFVSSFYIYPAALATSMKGYYHSQMAPLCRPNVDAAIDHYRRAGNFYMDAAGKYPEDDEKHAYFLNCGVQCFFKCGTPLRETLPILERIRLTMPKMMRIWGASAASKQGRDKVLGRALMLETKLLNAIKKGDFTLDDLAAPK